MVWQCKTINFTNFYSMNAENLKSQYNDIWEKFNDNEIKSILDRGFTFQFDENIIEPDILFIGINPAYKDGDPSMKNWYTQEQSLNYPYFKVFRTIEESLFKDYNRSISWTHIDLMVFRETDQKFIETTLFKDPRGLDFITEQLTIAKKRIEHIQPKIIVVSNALARILMGKDRFTKNGKEHNVWMDFKFEFDKEKGTDKILDSVEFPNTHVFFTSMLTGQRALDNGSKERLIWHINQVLKN